MGENPELAIWFAFDAIPVDQFLVSRLVSKIEHRESPCRLTFTLHFQAGSCENVASECDLCVEIDEHIVFLVFTLCAMCMHVM